MRDVIRERNAVLDAQMESMRSVQRSEAVYLRSTRKTTTKIEADVNKELASLTEDASALHEALKELANIAAEGTDSHVASMSNLVGQLSSRLKALSVVVKDQMDRTLEALQRQDQALREFAQRESDDMKKTAEDMIKA
jgi:cell division septum initiation protein DivIVA